MAITKDEQKAIYISMMRIRRFEEAAERLLKEKRMPGFAHLYIGEEAIASAVCANLRRDDYITSTHRGHGHCIAKGADLRFMMAELYGKEAGYCKGKGGSMHIADTDIGILGADGIVGAGQPISVGAALSAQVRGTDQVTVCFFGDGSTNQGTFHESLNLASIWKLPVVFICENNLYQITVPFSYHSNIRDIAVRAQAYDIPGVTVDGNDVMAVYEAAKVAVERARRGEGPKLIECKTYRHRGHFSGDPASYRPKDEVEAWLKRDPIPRYEQFLIDNGVMTREELDEAAAQVEKEIADAIAFAEAQPYPPVENTVKDVYSEDIVKEARDR